MSTTTSEQIKLLVSMDVKLCAYTISEKREGTVMLQPVIYRLGMGEHAHLAQGNHCSPLN